MYSLLQVRCVSCGDGLDSCKTRLRQVWRWNSLALHKQGVLALYLLWILGPAMPVVLGLLGLPPQLSQAEHALLSGSTLANGHLVHCLGLGLDCLIVVVAQA